VLGLFHAVPGARAFRRMLATQAVKPDAGADVFVGALDLLAEPAARSEAA
jgi:tRNA-dihydrouridine synthase A